VEETDVADDIVGTSVTMELVQNDDKLYVVTRRRV